MYIGLLGIILGLLVFLVLTYKGFSTYYVAAISALIIAVTNSLNPLTAITESFIGGLVEILFGLFTIIFLGAIFGKLFTDTGAASSIANTLIGKFIRPDYTDRKKIKIGLFVFLVIGGLATMGGIDAYIQVFTMFPIALLIAEVCDIPRRFIPGMLVLNCAFVAAPGAPQIMNVLAVHSLHQAGFNEITPLSGLIPGVIAALIIAVGGYFTLLYMINKDREKGNHFELGTVPPVPHKEGRKLPPFVLRFYHC